MRLVFDMEGNGLYESITRFHCLCLHDIDTGKKASYDTDRNNLNDGIGVLMAADTLIGHNIIGYDIRALHKLYPWFKLNPETRIFDTLVMSGLLKPERYGGHGLDAWGTRAGKPKPKHEDWSEFSPAMLNRCEVDVAINVFTYNELIEEAWELIHGVPYEKIFGGLG